MLNVNIENIDLKMSGRYRNIIRRAKFEMVPNGIFTILGKNGTGKTTLIKSITKLLSTNIYNYSGTVYYLNNDIFSYSPDALRNFRKEKVRYVFQDTMNSFDHLKTISYYFDLLAKDKSEIEELLEYFLLPDIKKLYKMHPYEVSGGMAQRISFILALLSHPEIIILDEPTSGIDSAIANLFLLKLKEFTGKNKNSVLLVTQDISFAEKASDEIAYLVNGVLSQL